MKIYKSKEEMILTQYQKMDGDEMSDLSRKRIEFKRLNVDEDRVETQRKGWYKPNIQIHFDLAVAVLALIGLLYRLEIIECKPRACDIDTMNKYLPRWSAIVLVAYFLKPFIIRFYNKCTNKKNHSYYAQSIFFSRIFYDVLFVFIPAIWLL